MHSVTTRAVGDGLRTGFGGEAVKRSIETQQAVCRKPEFPRQPHITVAAPACGANVAAAHQRRRIARRQDGVLAVAIGANGSLRHTAGHRFSVYARLIFAGHVTVAHAAGLGHAGTKGSRLCALNFMGRPVAGAAVGRGGVAFADLLAVNAAGVLGSNLLMATRANRFWDAFRVGILFVLYVAGSAGHRSVSRLCHLLPDIMAGGTSGATRFLRHAGRPCSQ